MSSLDHVCNQLINGRLIKDTKSVVKSTDEVFETSPTTYMVYQVCAFTQLLKIKEESDLCSLT